MVNSSGPKHGVRSIDASFCRSLKRVWVFLAGLIPGCRASRSALGYYIQRFQRHQTLARSELLR